MGTVIRSAPRAEFLTSVLTTAIEGGVNYWAEVVEYRWWYPDLDGGTAENDGVHATAYAVLRDTADGRKLLPKLTLDSIAKGLRAVLTGDPDELGISERMRETVRAHDRTNGRAEDAPDIDSIYADAIVQIALFGKVIYS